MGESCAECERTVEELNDNGIDLQADGYCDECDARLQKEWTAEIAELNRYWRSTRL